MLTQVRSDEPEPEGYHERKDTWVRDTIKFELGWDLEKVESLTDQQSADILWLITASPTFNSDIHVDWKLTIADSAHRLAMFEKAVLAVELESRGGELLRDSFADAIKRKTLRYIRNAGMHAILS